MNVRLTPEAEADITEAYAWYRERRASLGEDLLSSFETVLGVLHRPKPTLRSTEAFAAL